VEVIEGLNAMRPAVRCIAWLDNLRMNRPCSEEDSSTENDEKQHFDCGHHHPLIVMGSGRDRKLLSRPFCRSGSIVRKGAREPRVIVRGASAQVREQEDHGRQRH
jgi:hypothetical protein